VKILAGLERADSGTIEIGGSQVRLRSPTQSLQAGVAYVTQELSIVARSRRREYLPRRHWRPPDLDSGRLDERVRPFLELVGLGHIPSSTPAGSCRSPSSNWSKSPACCRATHAS